MSARNFPPSFWNSHYQPPPSASGSLSHHMSSADLYSTDPYHPAAVHTTGDPWHTHYQQYTAAAAHHHHRYYFKDFFLSRQIKKGSHGDCREDVFLSFLEIIEFKLLWNIIIS